MTTLPPVAAVRQNPRARWSLVAAIYVVLSMVQAWPLPLHLTTLLAGGHGDASLSSAVLWWNATHIPFSSDWWNALHYYPTQGVAAFTESMVGISLIASPVYWLTGSHIAAYNVAFLASWPLSAFAMYLLVRFLTGRDDAAFLAGLGYGFATFRGTGLAHIQTVTAYWLPIWLLGLHGYLRDGRRRWLVLFGVAWVLQSLSNGHYMLFGAVLIACWIGWFCATSGRWRTGAAILVAWAVASLPLVPVMNTYRLVHQQFGLVRSLAEIIAYSATLESWARVSSEIWLWKHVLPSGDANLFPGVTALTLVLVAAVLLVKRPDAGRPPLSRARRAVLAFLGLLASVALAGALVGLHAGPWRAELGGVVIARMTNLNRAAVLLLVSVGLLSWLTPSLRGAIRRRSPFVFYAAMVPLIGVFCFGPIMRANGAAMLSPAPYGWLLALPGYGELRTPPRFWMLATLCLHVAAGLAFSSLRLAGSRLRIAVMSVAVVGLLFDGWVETLPMGPPAPSWASVEAGGEVPILELPAGESIDYAATYRQTTHGRRVINGVSGYNPPHYEAMLNGLARRDPAMLAALATRGPYDVVVDREADPDGAVAAYVSRYPGAVHTRDDGRRVVYRIPRGPAEPELGATVSIVRADAVRYAGQGPLMIDGDVRTGWGDYPQVPDQWVQLDLGEVRQVAGLTHVIGEYLLDFPKHLLVEVSTDGGHWEHVWEGSTAAPTVLAYFREPLRGALRLPFEPHAARYIRLRQLDTHKSMWRISEILAHEPRAEAPGVDHHPNR